MKKDEFKEAIRGFLAALGYTSDDVRVHIDDKGNVTFQVFAQKEQNEKA